MFWTQWQLITENPTVLFRPACSERRQGCSYFVLLSFTRFQKGMALCFLYSVQGSCGSVPKRPILECTNVIQKPIFSLNRNWSTMGLQYPDNHILLWPAPHLTGSQCPDAVWNWPSITPLKSLYPLEWTSWAYKLASGSQAAAALGAAS